MIKVVALDIDGVLTDGMYQVSSDGTITKNFHCRDFDALRRLKQNYEVVLVTNGKSCGELYAEIVGVDFLFVPDTVPKEVALSEYLLDHICSFDQVLYCGDSLWDFGCIKSAQIGCFPKGAEGRLINACMGLDGVFELRVKGGTGIVEEIERILEIVNA